MFFNLVPFCQICNDSYDVVGWWGWIFLPVSNPVPFLTSTRFFFSLDNFLVWCTTTHPPRHPKLTLLCLTHPKPHPSFLRKKKNQTLVQVLEADEAPPGLPSSIHLSRLRLRAFMKKLLTVLSSSPSCCEMVSCISLDGRLFSLKMASSVRRWRSVKTRRDFFGVLLLSLPESCSFLLHASPREQERWEERRKQKKTKKQRVIIRQYVNEIYSRKQTHKSFYRICNDPQARK